MGAKHVLKTPRLLGYTGHSLRKSARSREVQFVVPMLIPPKWLTLPDSASRNCYGACKCQKEPAKPWQATFSPALGANCGYLQ